jgi:hypothetical protein
MIEDLRFIEVESSGNLGFLVGRYKVFSQAETYGR